MIPSVRACAPLDLAGRSGETEVGSMQAYLQLTKLKPRVLRGAGLKGGKYWQDFGVVRIL